MRRITITFLAALALGVIDVWRTTAPTTNAVVFSETMGTNPQKPWTGGGCDNAWIVFTNGLSNPFEQNSNANYGSGHTNGLSFKTGTTNLAESSIITTLGIDARGTSGSLSFYLNTTGLTNNNGWALLINSGGGFTARLSETSGTNHTWRNYTYTLQPADLVSNLLLQFQFSGGAANARIWLDQITLTVTFGTTNVIIPFSAQFVRIPGGNCLMGDQFEYIDLKHYTDEIPVHNVYISPLYMAITPTTCREYCDYLNNAITNGLIEVRTNIVYAAGGTNVFFYTHDASSSSRIQFQNNSFTVLNSRDLHPVTSVRWFGAIAYCNWLSQQGGFDSCYNTTNGDVDFSKNGFRLPTEAEWEYAARAGSEAAYTSGADARRLGGHAWFSENAMKRTHAVAQKRANAWGLFDMHGNVSEWCNDVYSADAYAKSSDKNPQGPASGKRYCLRGGAWNSSADAVRVFKRGGETPGFADACLHRDAIGFRCVRKALPDK